MADVFEKRGLKVFGPSKKAAMLEGSKVFCKDVLVKAGVPTARAQVFDDYEAALEELGGWDPPLVVKADGLAAGKGSIVAMTEKEAVSRFIGPGDYIGFELYGTCRAPLSVVREIVRQGESSKFIRVEFPAVVASYDAADHHQGPHRLSLRDESPQRFCPSPASTPFF